MLRLLSAVLLLCPLASARAQFTMQDSGTTADLRGIVNVGNGTAWASGNHGTILRTEDSGFVWQGCAVPPGAEQLDFRGIQAFDDQTAIVMSSGKGDLSRVYKTTDGCQSWKLVFTNPDADGFFDAVEMNPSGAMVIGDPVTNRFSIFVSDRNEENWRAESDLYRGSKNKVPASLQGDALFAASNSCMDGHAPSVRAFVVGGTAGPAIIWAEHHAPLDGEQWVTYTRRELPLARSESGGPFSLYFRLNGRSEQWMIVGGDYKKPDDRRGTAVFIHGGKFLGLGSIQVPQTPPNGYRSSVAYDAKTKTWITVGPNGTDISSDDGRNWRALKPGYGDEPDADKQWNALSLPYVVGPHGRIGRLRDNALSQSK